MILMEQAVQIFGIVPVVIACFVLGSMALTSLGLAPLAFEDE